MTKESELENFFKEHNKVAIAFSGGVDSAYLLYAAMHLGAQVKAFYVKSQFQPRFELEDAKRLTEELHADMEIIELDVLGDEAPQQAEACAGLEERNKIQANPENRCYYCKKLIMESIISAARSQGYAELLDGTNASDEVGDRPGMKVLSELRIYSPLRICGITKDEVRSLSRAAGLFTWDKPAYACLATRIPVGTKITAELLQATEESEEFLGTLGFRDFRVRYRDGVALLQLREEDFARFEAERDAIAGKLGRYYSEVRLDPKPRM